MNPTILIPTVILGLCVLVASAGPSLLAKRRQRSPRKGARELGRRWLHAINTDRCTGCEACIEVCPTHVLELVDHKSQPVNDEHCIECRQCAQVCPTTALVMHREGAEPPTLRCPELDPFLQTAVPGQYLIGEVAGKPLVKNAVNMGRVVVEHMTSLGLNGTQGDGESADSPLDIAIVGGGPAGLSAGLTAIHRGFSVAVLEKSSSLAATISSYPKGKDVLAEPLECRNLSFLPVFDASKEDLLATWQSVVTAAQLDVRTNTTVDTVTGEQDHFEIKTPLGSIFARRIVLAIGTRGKPRTLGVPGESLIKVSTMLDDPYAHRGQRVLVVGGGDSAIEAAVAMADSGAAQVALSYRGRAFARAKKRNKVALEDRAAKGKIEILLQSKVKEIRDNIVVIQLADGREIENDAVYVLIGADAPIKWLEKVGVSYVDRSHWHEFGASDALVAQFGFTDECPENPKKAAARILGRREPSQLIRLLNNNVVRRAEQPRAQPMRSTRPSPQSELSFSKAPLVKNRPSLPPPIPSAPISPAPIPRPRGDLRPLPQLSVKPNGSQRPLPGLTQTQPAKQPERSERSDATVVFDLSSHPFFEEFDNKETKVLQRPPAPRRRRRITSS